MKIKCLVLLLFSCVLLLSACTPSQPSPAAATGVPPLATVAIPPSAIPQPNTAVPPTPAPTATPPPPTATPLPPTPTPVTRDGWSTSASTFSELSFAFPGSWDGASPLTFGEGLFVKDPDLPLGVTFQIKLQGKPAALLEAWGSKDVGVVGIVSFTPETVSPGEAVIISRMEAQTKIATGNGITAQVAYLQRAKDTLEITWFSPSDQWETMSPVFQLLLENVEIWRNYNDPALGLQTMYPHDWLDPQPPVSGQGMWFQSPDKATGLYLVAVNEIADPVQMLSAWKVDRLAELGLSNCTILPGDRMNTMSGQWESKTGVCASTSSSQVTYEITYVPNKDRLLEIITYAPAGAWEEANRISFNHLLGMMIDIRP